MNISTPYIIIQQFLAWCDIFLIVLGIIGNSLIIIVSLKQKIREFTKFLIMTEAIWDFFDIIIEGVRYFLLSFYEIEIRNLNLTTCKLYTFLLNYFSDVSVWGLMVLSTERYLLLKYPTNFTLRNLTKKHAVIFTVLLLLLSFVKNFVQLLSVLNETRMLCTIYSEKGQKINSYVDFVLNILVPFIWVAIFTLGSIMLIRTQNGKLSKTVLNCNLKDPSRHVLRMIFIISIYRFTSSIPLTALQIMVNTGYLYQKDINIPLIILMHNISTMLLLSNNSIKFYLFYHVSPFYQITISELMRSNCKKIKTFIPSFN
uniref:GCR042 n=1 Tax=Schmidtea mediterranea TaxID=79327 RepID=A0A193KUG7_SCHMD|nr:GCR042 [Schmidtea mediterranea]